MTTAQRPSTFTRADGSETGLLSFHRRFSSLLPRSTTLCFLIYLSIILYEHLCFSENFFNLYASQPCYVYLSASYLPLFTHGSPRVTHYRRLELEEILVRGVADTYLATVEAGAALDLARCDFRKYRSAYLVWTHEGNPNGAVEGEDTCLFHKKHRPQNGGASFVHHSTLFNLGRVNLAPQFV